MYFIITLLIAFLGAYTFKKLKIPVGAMIGSLVFVAIYNMLTNQAVFYSDLKPLLQLGSGILIGSRINNTIIKNLKHLWKPYVVMMITMLIVLVSMSSLLSRLSDIDTMSTLFGLAPGGATDLTILSADYNANISFVALVHTARRLFIMVGVPFIAGSFFKKEEHISLHKNKKDNKTIHLIAAVLCGVLCIFVFKIMNVKSAVMLGAIVGSALSNLCYHNYSTPKNYPFLLQTISGAFVGSTINVDLLSQLSSYSIAVVIVIVETLIIILLNTFLLKYLFKMSPLTSLLASAPGALSDMTLLSEELGGDMPTVAALQIARMFSIILLIPYLTVFI